MKITVTGGSGFVGSHIADQFSKNGHEVTIFDKKESLWLRKDQKIIIGDLQNESNLKKAIYNANVVCHFAALSDIEDALNKPIETVNENILGTVKVLELCCKYKIKKFIHASSVYANSSEGGFYGSSKRASEDYIEEYSKRYGLDYTILRFGTIYGERSNITNGVTRIIINAIKTGKVVYFGNKESVREYVHVLDVAKACIQMLENKFKNKHVVLTGDKPIKVMDFLKSLVKIMKISNKIEFGDRKFGHYIKTPYSYKFKTGEKFALNSSINFNKGLNKLVNKLKKSQQIK